MTGTSWSTIFAASANLACASSTDLADVASLHSRSTSGLEYSPSLEEPPVTYSGLIQFSTSG
jgi:hypothetical protein